MDNRQLQALLQQMNNGGGQPGFGQGPPPLCEFKAGRMNFDGRMVTPERTRGWIRVTRDPLQPGMITFAYLDEGKTVQESLILFPDIAKFEKVKQSDDRVYLLEIQPEPRRLFFWMQDDDKENDADRMKKCHNAINGVETPAAAAGGDAAAASSTSAQAPRMQTSGFQTSAAAAGGANASASQQAQQAAMMEQFFAQMQQQQQRKAGPGIGSVITPDSLSKLFSEMTQEEKDEIKQHLPANQQSDEGIRENLLSPQLKQAMQSLSQACETSEENVLMILAMCNLDTSETNLDGVEAIIRGFVKKFEEGNGE